MKHLTKLSFFFLTAISMLLWSCNSDDITPSLEELFNTEYDLVLISSESPDFKVSFSATATDLERVSVEIFAQGSTTPVATKSLRNITSNSLNRINLSIPFPSNDIAASGLYEVKYTTISKSGTSNAGSYIVNLINNKIPELINPCEYTQSLPAGASVWIRLFVPQGENLPDGDDDIFLTGSFGDREGGSSWDGGGGGASPFKFNRISPTCYELAINLENGDEFKITRGDWPKERTNADGSTPDNITYAGESDITIIAYNWKDLPTVAPDVVAGEVFNIPAGAVKPGMLTIVANLPNSIGANAEEYFAVQKGATNLDNAYKMIPFADENRLAVAVPRASGTEYVIVRGNDISNLAMSAFGFDVEATWDGATNPAIVVIKDFRPNVVTPPNPVNQLLLVGGATPGGWNNDEENTQFLTETSPGILSFTTTFSNGNGGFLLISEVGNWGDNSKIGRTSGNFLKGTLDFAGGDFPEPGDFPEGTYKIEVNLKTGVYTLTPQ